MLQTKQMYKKLADKLSPPSPKVKDFTLAFLIGGLICTLGQILTEIYILYLDLTIKQVRMAVPSTIIFLAGLLTGLRVFHKIAKRAGAGTLVPISGFSNAVVSPAIEFKTEGWVLGVGANMFRIAGPVIAYGTIASVVYGLIYWLTTLF